MKPSLIDPHTGESFVPKRTNQRFARRANQIAFNNAKAKELRDQHLVVDNAIKRNWLIIKDLLNGKESIECSYDRLSNLGFAFRHFNNMRLRQDMSYYAIYDLGLRSKGDDLFELIDFNHD